jgi:hypothetical protein
MSGDHNMKDSFDCPRCGHCCPERTWVGLTDEEIITHFQTNVDIGSLLSFVDGARYAEAKLKERNG